jgi:DNA-binding PucR family transcriptional regulator
VLLFRRDDLHGIALRTFERSASIVGVVLLSQERVEAEQSRDVAALLRTLIAPRQGEPTLTRAHAVRFGLDLAQPLCLLVVELEQATRTGFWSRRLRANAALGERVLDEVDGALVLVCGATLAQDVAGKFDAFARRELGQAFRGMLSRPVSTQEEIPALYAAARRGLSVLGRLGMRAGIVAQNEMALYSVLFETHDRASLGAFLDATIGAVTAHDARRGSDLTATLLAYLDGQQNATVTAKRLGIHVNTVRQRLATIEALLGHWGSNASRALEIHMALRLWRLCAVDAMSRSTNA